MALLSTLKLTSLTHPSSQSPAQLRRTKLLNNLDLLIACARAKINGEAYMATKYQTVVDDGTGLKRKVPVPKTVRPWFFKTDNNKFALCINYGTTKIEIAKGKYSIEINQEKDIVPVLEVVKTAVQNGELDQALEATSNKMRAAFVR